MKTSCCHTKKVQKEDHVNLCTNRDCDSYLKPTGLIERVTWKKTTAICFIIFFFVFSFDDFSFSGDLGEDQLKSRKFTVQHHEIVPLTKENLKLELDVNRIICPEQVYAQIMIESGHLESFLVKHVSNLLGMRYPFKRQTTAIGIFLPESNLIIKGSQAELKKYASQNHYAVYANWQECVQDYKLWQDYCFKLTDKYLAFLGKYYAEDTEYVEKIKKLSK